MVLREVITDLILLDIATSFRQTHLYNLYRVLDLVVFSFVNSSAKQKTSLHVQCPVEITGPQGQLFSSELLDQPAPASGNHDPLPNAYDLALHSLPPEERTMADSALEAIHSTLPQAIRHVALPLTGLHRADHRFRNDDSHFSRFRSGRTMANRANCSGQALPAYRFRKPDALKEG